MNLLAIDTATEACSVALSSHGQVLEHYQLAPRRHAELVLPMIDAVLAEAGLHKQQIDAIAVGKGPGAFTGVRLAISVAQGIALGLDLPVLGISSLAALAQDLAGVADDAMVLACMDARMGEVYAGVYRRGADGLMALVGSESVGPVSALGLPDSARWVVVGSGCGSYAAALTALIGAPALADAERYPRAAMIARLAVPGFQRGEGLAPELVLPSYLRDKVALTSAERIVA